MKFRIIIVAACLAMSFGQSVISAPQTPEMLYAKAYGLYTRGDLKSAQKTYEDSLAAYPSFAAFYDGLGDVFLKKGDFSKAFDYYKKASEKAPFNNMYKTHMYGAVYASSQSKIQKAKDDFSKAAFLSPNNKVILTNISDYFDQNYKNFTFMTDFYTSGDENLLKGNKARFEGKSQLAIKYYNDSIKTAPAKYKAYNNLSLVYVDNNDDANALICLTKALKESPKSPYINNNLGVLMSKKGDFTKAENYFKEAVNSYKTYSSGFNNNAVNTVIKASQSSLKHVAPLNSVLDNDTDNLATRKLLAKLHGLGGNYTKSVELYSKVVDKNDYNYEFLSDYGFYLFKSGKYKEAESILSKSITLFPYDMKNVFLLARVQEKTYKAGDAIDNYEKVIAKAPNIHEVYYYYGSFLSLLGKETESNKFLKKYIELAQDNPYSYVVKNSLEVNSKI